MEHSEQHAPIPGSPDFPVVWENPDDERLFWTQDAMHFPEPLTVMDDELAIRIAHRHGFGRATESYEMPIRPRVRRINTYYYLAMAPVVVPPEEMEAMGERSQEKIGVAIERLGDLWKNEYLPEIKEHIEYWDAFDLHGTSMPELLAHLDETTQRLGRLWEIHFLLAFPMLVSISTFDEFYRDLFGSEDAFGAYRLLQGFENKTVETGRRLWQLSREALDIPEVRKVLEENAAADVIPALEGSEKGREFLTHLRAYLDEYGQRGDMRGVSYPTWAENPVSALKMLKDYTTQSGGGPDEELAALASERERLLVETYEALSGYPQAVRDQFDSLLKMAQDATVLSEDHGFWIDFHSTAGVRQVFLEFGRRFVEAGVIEQPDDVFHLSLDELRETAERQGLDRRELVAQRKAEIQYFSAIQPPPALGTPPPGPPPDNPMNRAMGKFFGGPSRQQSEPGLLEGNPGSPDVVRGTARVLRSLTERDALQQGEVLVAETTAPTWTPLFATAAAVVTDTGGILSHCAVVAREYGIPAVVGTCAATATIKDGQTIEVDGDEGTVRIVSPD